MSAVVHLLLFNLAFNILSILILLCAISLVHMLWKVLFCHFHLYILCNKVGNFDLINACMHRLVTVDCIYS